VRPYVPPVPTAGEPFEYRGYQCLPTYAGFWSVQRDRWHIVKALSPEDARETIDVLYELAEAPA